MKYILIIASLFLGSISFAQTKYVDLIQGEFLSPFQSSRELMDYEMDILNFKIGEAQKEITEREKAIETERKNIARHGMTSLDFVAHLHTQIASLPSGVVDNINFDSVRALPQVQEVSSFIDAGKQETVNLFGNDSAYDAYLQDTMDFTMAMGFHAFRYELSLLLQDVHSLSSGKYADLKSLYKKIDKVRTDYVGYKDQYGQSKDTRRTTAYKKFFLTLREGFKEIDRASETKKQRWSRKAMLTIEKYRDLAFKFHRYLFTIPSVVRLLKSVFAVQQPTEDSVPISKNVGDVVSNLAKAQGLKMEVEGAENLPTTFGEKDVFLFTPSHRDGLRDALGISQLGVQDIAFVAAVNNFITKLPEKYRPYLFKKLNANNGFAIAGTGAEPKTIPKIFRILEESKVRKFLIYPEGRLPEGIGATATIRENFFAKDGLIDQLEKDGYRVNIVPITMRYNANLFKKVEITPVDSLLVKVFPTITHETRKVITALGGPEAMELIMRVGLTDDMVTNETLLWGQVRGSKVAETLPRFLFPKYLKNAPKCKSIFDGLTSPSK